MKLPDLIDRAALLEMIAKRKQDTCNGSLTCIQMERMIKAIRLVDAVPVVRCRECKHMWQASLSGNMYCELHGTCVFVVRPDEYCSRGERKEDDHERKGSDSL